MHINFSRRVGAVAVAGVAVAALAGAGAGYAAVTATAQPAIKTSTPHSANDVTNIDVLRQQLRNYYGDPLGTGQFAATGNYAREASRVAADGTRYLAQHRAHGRVTKAIVMDVDDTTLATWNYEIASNWAFNPTTNADYVLGEKFPPVPGMVAMATAAAREGYAVFYLTGRGSVQEDATLGNLTEKADYPKPTTLRGGEDGLFTKPDVTAYPAYLSTACAADPGGKCTTIHYKSATRAHIESLGYDIVANFGDQYSDLIGGHADRTFKLPNPNYFLP